MNRAHTDQRRKKRAGKNAKRSSSRYDYVKVRVWVEDHHYVLSRYLVCRALVGTKVSIQTPAPRVC